MLWKAEQRLGQRALDEGFGEGFLQQVLIWARSSGIPLFAIYAQRIVVG